MTRAINTRTEALQMAVTACAVAAITVAVTLLCVPQQARAHGGSGKDYTSQVTSIDSADLPIDAEILGGDDEIRIENVGDDELIVEGYEKDPYLRIGPDGVFVNRNSTAYFLNEERFTADLPPDFDPEAKPDWKLVRESPLFYTFHDHRIHWMAKSVPPSVDVASDAVQKVYDWSIPMSYEGQSGTINGRLDYIGGGADSGNRAALITALAIAVMLAVFIFDARRRRRRHLPADGAAL